VQLGIFLWRGRFFDTKERLYIQPVDLNRTSGTQDAAENDLQEHASGAWVKIGMGREGKGYRINENKKSRNKA